MGRKGKGTGGASLSGPGAIASGDGATSVSAHSGDAPSRMENEMTVTVITKVDYKPFTVPSFARLEMPPRPKQDGIQELPGIPLRELEPHVLDALAGRWLDNLYASVERASPWAKKP